MRERRERKEALAPRPNIPANARGT